MIPSSKERYDALAHTVLHLWESVGQPDPGMGTLPESDKRHEQRLAPFFSEIQYPTILLQTGPPISGARPQPQQALCLAALHHPFQ